MITAIGSVCAAAGLAIGGFGMATGSGGAMAAMQHKGMQHMATQSAGANQVLSEREVQRIRAAGTLPVIRGRVTTDARIKVRPSSVPAGRYKFVVVDETPNHNWHIKGPGSVDKSTSISGVERLVWRITLSNGTYDIVCDRHPVAMHKQLSVS